MMSGVALFSSCSESPSDSGSEAKAENETKAVEVVPTSELAKLLSESAVVLEGNELKKTNVGDAEKYIVYYGASW